MSKKQLPTTGIINELEGASAFFTRQVPPLAEVPVEKIDPQPTTSQDPVIPPTHKPAFLEMTPSKKTAASKPVSPLPSPKRPAKLEGKHVSKPASMLASTHISPPPITGEDWVETIRKTVKQVGKEPLFVRMTPEEKRKISAIVYAFNEMYRDEGGKTSENEIGRIAIAFLVEDYHQNGQTSVLARVLAALNA